MNNVVVGAPSEAAVPVCGFDVVGKQLFAVATLELLDDALVEEVVELEELDVADEELVELEELDVADEELVELVMLEELEVIADEELLNELLLFDAAPMVAALAPPGSEESPLHAVASKHRPAKMLKKL